MEAKTIHKNLSFARVRITLYRIGEDYCVLLEGGDRPHIGCTVLAVPRESLSGDGSPGATSSVLNMTGHKDEILCRALAERVAKHTGRTAVCTGGFHVDHMNQTQIQEVVELISGLELPV